MFACLQGAFGYVSCFPSPATHQHSPEPQEALCENSSHQLRRASEIHKLMAMVGGRHQQEGVLALIPDSMFHPYPLRMDDNISSSGHSFLLLEISLKYITAFPSSSSFAD